MEVTVPLQKTTIRKSIVIIVTEVLFVNVYVIFAALLAVTAIVLRDWNSSFYYILTSFFSIILLYFTSIFFDELGHFWYCRKTCKGEYGFGFTYRKHRAIKKRFFIYAYKGVYHLFWFHFSGFAVRLIFLLIMNCIAFLWLDELVLSVVAVTFVLLAENVVLDHADLRKSIKCFIDRK